MKILSAFPKIPYSLKLALLIVILAKLLVFSVGYATTYLNHTADAPTAILLSQFNRWDAPHYIDLAQNGYVNTGDAANFIVFFPLYPILIRLVTFDFSYASLSALVLSNFCSVFAFVYLYKLTKLDFDHTAALKAVVFLSIFPTAYFLSAPYTEGLFFALSIASLYYARLSKWPLAGFLSFLAASTRLAGLLLVPVLVVEYLHQRGWRLRRIDMHALDTRVLWACFAAGGFLIYLGINAQVTGSPFTFLTVQAEHWHNTLDPWLGLNLAWQVSGSQTFPSNLTWGNCAAGVCRFRFGGFGCLC